MKIRALAGLIVLAGVAALAAACSGSSGDSEAIEVRLLNWSIEPSVKSVSAGEVTFKAVHDTEGHAHGAASGGGEIHELAVTRLNPDGTKVQLATTGEIAAGKSKNLTLKLAPGEYELQCNLVEKVAGAAVLHYSKGMHTKFTVTS